MRLDAKGAAALDELRGIITRYVDDRVDYSETLDYVLRFHRAVDPRERERVVAELRRERASRFAFPGGQRPV